MAIDRTAYNALVDDTGSNNGTIWDKNAIKTVLLDPMDTALAAVSGGAATIQTTTLTGTQNNFAATAARHLILRCNNASLLTLTGFAAGTDGDIIDVISVGAGQVDLAHQNASSTAGNRLINFATSAATSLAAGVGVGSYIYDGTTARWRLALHNQGAWITPTFNAADFTASGSMTLTVDSGDVKTYRSWLKDRTLLVQAVLLTTTTGGTASFALYVKVPGGYSATGEFTGSNFYFNNAAPWTMGPVWIEPTTIPTKIQLYIAGFGNANWALGTNTIGVYANLALEVL